MRERNGEDTGVCEENEKEDWKGADEKEKEDSDDRVDWKDVVWIGWGDQEGTELDDKDDVQGGLNGGADDDDHGGLNDGDGYEVDDDDDQWDGVEDNDVEDNDVEDDDQCAEDEWREGDVVEDDDQGFEEEEGEWNDADDDLSNTDVRLEDRDSGNGVLIGEETLSERDGKGELVFELGFDFGLDRFRIREESFRAIS